MLFSIEVIKFEKVVTCSKSRITLFLDGRSTFKVTRKDRALPRMASGRAHCIIDGPCFVYK